MGSKKMNLWRCVMSHIFDGNIGLDKIHDMRRRKKLKKKQPKEFKTCPFIEEVAQTDKNKKEHKNYIIQFGTKKNTI